MGFRPHPTKEKEMKPWMEGRVKDRMVKGSEGKVQLKKKKEEEDAAESDSDSDCKDSDK